MFKDRLRLIRKSRGLTLQCMADHLDIVLRGYQYYESGRNSPPLENLIKIANLLDVSIDYLVGRDEFLKSRGIDFDNFDDIDNKH